MSSLGHVLPVNLFTLLGPIALSRQHPCHADAVQPAVVFAEPQSISPMMRGRSKEVDADGESFNLDRMSSSPKQHRANLGAKRLSGRPAPERSTSKLSLKDTPLAPVVSDEGSGNVAHPHRHLATQGLVSQITEWIKHEKARRAERRKKRGKASRSATLESEDAVSEEPSAQLDGSAAAGGRRPSDASEGSVALENLENILEKSLSLGIGNSPPSRRSTARRVPSSRKLRRQSTAASSDTDYHEGEAQVPSCDVFLDNTKTVTSAGGTSSSDEATTPGSRSKDKKAWSTFKYEIVRLTHTLRLKGWRRVPMEKSSEIDVERLSGALTNAVYVVSPPKDLPAPEKANGDSSHSHTPKKPPP